MHYIFALRIHMIYSDLRCMNSLDYFRMTVCNLPSLFADRTRSSANSIVLKNN
jgi:L-cystine uptake protein TcyP (sodium:dicarboxylate symporter family)